MQFKRIHVIINPAAGEEEPILSYLNTPLGNAGVVWEIFITKQDGDATRFATSCLGETDVVAVYGGDGTVAEVAQVLQGKDIPLAIIPGGTANVLAKELKIPQDTRQAIELLASENKKVVQMDMASANGEPFIIRLNLGVMADMVLEASRELKDKVGQLAYGITAIQTMVRSEVNSYTLNIDGVEIVRDGVALTVTNCGSIGIGDYSFLPDIRIDDGLLDVILLRKADLLSVLKVASTTLLKTESETLEHWRCKEVEINVSEPQKFILDDAQREAGSLVIKVLAGALNVVVPAP